MQHSTFLRVLRSLCVVQSLVLATVPASATLEQLLDNGPTAARLNIVFLSEGYTESEMGKYSDDANALLNRILNTSPYNAYHPYFNAFTISVASNESGSDHPERNEFRDTYFNSTFNSNGILRLVTIDGVGSSRVFTLLQEFMPEYDIVILIVNDAQYGGSGGFPSITSTNQFAGDIAIHEIGHTFANLTDEYETTTPGFSQFERHNSTSIIERELVKWNEWIDAETPLPTPESFEYNSVVGLFEGSQYTSTGWYRPRLNCMMRSIGQPFCEICVEQHIHEMYQHVRPAQYHEPTAGDLKVKSDSNLTFSVSLMQPALHALSITWVLDGNPIPGETDTTLSISGALMGSGAHILAVEIADETDMVREESIRTLLRDRIVWVVEVTPVTSVVETKGRPVTQITHLRHYPDPSDAEITFEFYLLQDAHTVLTVTDMFGRQVATPLKQFLPRGMHRIGWNSDNLQPGVYFYRVEASAAFATSRLRIID